MSRGVTDTCTIGKIDEISLDKSIPEESIICSLPQCMLRIGLRSALEAACQVEGVREIYWRIFDQSSKEFKVCIFIGVV